MGKKDKKKEEADSAPATDATAGDGAPAGEGGDGEIVGGPRNPQQIAAQKRLQQTQAQVDEVVDIMRTNVEKVLERDQKLSELDDRADALQQGASQFEQQAGKLKRKFWLQNLKMMIIMGVIGLVIVGIIAKMVIPDSVFSDNSNKTPIVISSSSNTIEPNEGHISNHSQEETSKENHQAQNNDSSKDPNNFNAKPYDEIKSETVHEPVPAPVRDTKTKRLQKQPYKNKNRQEEHLRKPAHIIKNQPEEILNITETKPEVVTLSPADEKLIEKDFDEIQDIQSDFKGVLEDYVAEEDRINEKNKKKNNNRKSQKDKKQRQENDQTAEEESEHKSSEEMEKH